MILDGNLPKLFGYYLLNHKDMSLSAVLTTFWSDGSMTSETLKNGKDLSFSSSNSKVASVSKKGVITALKPGKTIITIRSTKGKVSRTLPIEVVAPAAPKLYSVVSTKKGSAVAKWSKVEGAKYEVRYDVSFPLLWRYKTNLLTQTSTTIVKNLRSNKLYTFQVRARYNQVYSDWSNRLTIKIK